MRFVYLKSSNSKIIFLITYYSFDEPNMFAVVIKLARFFCIRSSLLFQTFKCATQGTILKEP